MLHSGGPNNPNYPDGIRPTLFREGLEYQDWVRPHLASIAIVPQYNVSQRGQLENGESWQGVEIKLDSRISDSGRLSIEIAEKTRAANAYWIPSGIRRDDNTVIYVQGNREIVFCFGRKHLLDEYYKRERNAEQFHESHGTIRKFYIPIVRAAYIAFAVFAFRDSRFGRQGRLQFDGSTRDLFGWDGGERQLVKCRPNGDLLLFDFVHQEYH